jgi:hypothetical protein
LASVTSSVVCTKLSDLKTLFVGLFGGLSCILSRLFPAILNLIFSFPSAMRASLSGAATVEALADHKDTYIKCIEHIKLYSCDTSGGVITVQQAPLIKACTALVLLHSYHK